MVEGTRSTSAGTVSAEQHERLERDFAALVDQFEAANEVLSAMGRSAGDPDTLTDGRYDPSTARSSPRAATRST